MKYQIKELRKIAVSELTVSDEAEGFNPLGAGDREALGVSIDDVGLLEPLTVSMHEGASGGWKVLDGAGRLAKLKERGEIEADCIVVDCGDWNEYVLSKNVMGRTRAAGCRIMSYLVMHRAAVLSAADEQDHGGGVARATSDEVTRFSVSAIAARLGYKDRKDVGLGVELLLCEACGVDLHGDELDGIGMKRIRGVLNDVLRGKTPIRKWKAAFAGGLAGSQDGECGKALADYKEICFRGFQNLQSAWKNWSAVPDERVPELRNHFRVMLAEAPQCMRREFADAINCTWTEAELKGLRKQIDNRLKK